MQLDPISPPFRRSRAIIVARVRRTLLDADARAPIIPEYAALLEEAGEADEHVLFALAVHHAVLGQSRVALAVLDKLVVLAPDNGEVWRMKGDVHSQYGEHDLARECRARAARVPVPNMAAAKA
jgi:Flp pilus assembly protein TadD